MKSGSAISKEARTFATATALRAMFVMGLRMWLIHDPPASGIASRTTSRTLSRIACRPARHRSSLYRCQILQLTTLLLLHAALADQASALDGLNLPVSRFDWTNLDAAVAESETQDRE
jgi:hypothetical protein